MSSTNRLSLQSAVAEFSDKIQEARCAD